MRSFQWIAECRDLALPGTRTELLFQQVARGQLGGRLGTKDGRSGTGHQQDRESAIAAPLASHLYYSGARLRSLARPPEVRI
jgi:hypothetical protein